MRGPRRTSVINGLVKNVVVKPRPLTLRRADGVTMVFQNTSKLRLTLVGPFIVLRSKLAFTVRGLVPTRSVPSETWKLSLPMCSVGQEKLKLSNRMTRGSMGKKLIDCVIPEVVMVNFSVFTVVIVKSVRRKRFRGRLMKIWVIPKPVIPVKLRAVVNSLPTDRCQSTVKFQTVLLTTVLILVKVGSVRGTLPAPRSILTTRHLFL